MKAPKRIKIRGISLLALSCATLIGCNHLAEKQVDVAVGGHRLHLLILGEGRRGPAVILESGAGGRIGWHNTRNHIGRFAQVVTYDRAGFGQSEAGPAPRDARTIARELHTALHRAGVLPPYLLVGQSSGGLSVQVFAALYPGEVAGLVLVDPTHASTELCLSVDDVQVWFMTHQPEDWPRVEAATRGAPAGLQGFLACKYKLMETFIETVPEARRPEMRKEWWALIEQIIGPNPDWELAGGAQQEATVMADSIRQAIAARPLPEVPIFLLAAGKTDLYQMPAEGVTPNVLELQAESQRWRRAAYQKWVDDTPGARLVVVEGSGHDIESDRPQVVIDAVRDVHVRFKRAQGAKTAK